MHKGKLGVRKIAVKPKRWLLYVLGISALLLILTTLVFAIYKDKISCYILKSTNNLTQGEVFFDDISLRPFIHFPSLTISFNNVVYYENKNESRDSLAMPIANLEYVYAGINLFELTKGNVVFKSIHIKNGSLNLIKYSDSTLNVTNAIRKISSDTASIIEKTTSETDTVKHRKFSIFLDKIKANNIELTYNNKLNGNYTSLSINRLESKLSIENDSIIADVDLQLLANAMPVTPFRKAKNINVEVKSSICFYTPTKKLRLNKSSFTIYDAKFNADGIVDLGSKYVDVTIDGDDKELSFIRLFLQPAMQWNLGSGEVFFQAAVKGSINGSIPKIDCRFGAKNLDVFNPKSPFKIDDLTILGSFNSGTDPKLANAELNIDTISAILPDGYLEGKFKLNNFSKPEIDYLVDLKTNITGLNNVLKIKNIEEVKGVISLHSEYKGSVLNGNAASQNRQSYLNLELSDISFSIPNKVNVKAINASVTGNLDTLCIGNLTALIGNSDITIDGTAFNLTSLILNDSSQITSNLHVTSNLFDLVDVLNYGPNIGEAFPYQIRNLNSDISCFTTRDQLFSKSPGVQFTINNNETRVSIDNLIPEVTVLNGSFFLGENQGQRLLTFNSFDVQYGTGALKADVIVHAPVISEKLIEISTRLIDFEAGKFVFYRLDSLPDLLKGFLNGYLTCNLTMSSNKNILFSRADLSGEKLWYETDSGTYRLERLSFKTSNTNFNKRGNGKLETLLSSDIWWDIRNLKSPKIGMEEASGSFWFNYDSVFYVNNLICSLHKVALSQKSSNYTIGQLSLSAKQTNFNLQQEKNPLESLNTNVSVEVKNIQSEKLKLEGIKYDIYANSGEFGIQSLNSKVLGDGGSGSLFIKPFIKPVQLQINYQINQFDTKKIAKLFSEKQFIDGKLNMAVNLGGSVNSFDSLFNDLSGNIHLSGDSLMITGIDIDNFLKNVEKSQNYDLVDMGAFMVAGPFGLMLSRGTSISKLLFTDDSAKSSIPHFKSHINLSAGVFNIGDMAFTTHKNRIAAIGQIDFNTKKLSVEVAVVDAAGCSMISQVIAGPINKPKLSELKVVESLFAPVTNLYKDVVDKKCTPFYTGTIAHPKPEK